MNKKSDLRNLAKTTRKNLNMELISQKIINKIVVSTVFKNAENVMIFYPLKNEINLLPLLEYKDKNFYLPRIDNDDLLACPYKEYDKLSESSFKTKEPLTPPVDKIILDLIFVPALLADKENYRLGYGKGFYDRFLKYTKAIKIIPIPKALVVNKLPIETHDRKVDLVITE